MAQTAAPILSLAGVTKYYGGVLALNDISVDVAPGEFLMLLGPSGFGKSTLLRVISGLEQPDYAERMDLARKSMIGVLPEHRNVSTVFQHYALFPHMSVGENVEYSLKIRKRSSAECKKAAMDALGMVRLPDKYDRRIHQLSGGERQRVALARALVMGPDTLLLDEPMAAIDEKLRQDMQVELMELRCQTGKTFILVTHSQEEAITMSDRIVLLRGGKIEQIATPRQMFTRPATRFAADFVGIENLLDAKLLGATSTQALAQLQDQTFSGEPVCDLASAAPGTSVFVGIRAEDLMVSAAGSPASGLQIKGKLIGNVYKGRFRDVTYQTALGPLTARVGDDAAIADETTLSFDPLKTIIGLTHDKTR